MYCFWRKFLFTPVGNLYHDVLTLKRFRVDRCRMQTTMTEQPAINTQLWWATGVCTRWRKKYPGYWQPLVKKTPNTSQGSEATRLRSDWILSNDWVNCEFSGEFDGERILKIGQHLVKLRQQYSDMFLTYRGHWRGFLPTGRSEAMWVFLAVSVCLFVRTIPSERLNVRWWNVLGALDTNLARVQMSRTKVKVTRDKKLLSHPHWQCIVKRAP